MGKATSPVNIDGVEFDALLEEERVLEAESPDYPIEDGFTVNDTIIIKPMTLSMILYVTDTPVTWKSSGHGGSGWADGVIQKLEKLYFSKDTVTVKTSAKTYKNMAISSITISKTPDVGYARQIPITFKEIRKTSSKKTTMPDSYGKSGDSGASAGTASSSTSTVSASSSSSGSSGGETNKASILYNLASSAGLLPS